jgi:hypothetical protein
MQHSFAGPGAVDAHVMRPRAEIRAKTPASGRAERREWGALPLTAITLAAMQLPDRTAETGADGSPAGNAPDRELLTAAEAAVLLRVERSWIYAHAAEIGGWRLLGDRGPWRFARQRLLQGPASSPDVLLARRRARPARRTSGRLAGPELLPIAPRAVRSMRPVSPQARTAPSRGASDGATAGGRRT